VGFSGVRNYTDLDRPAGSRDTYTVNTVDRYSRGSATDACLESVTVSVLPPDLTQLFIFVALMVGVAFWLVILGLFIGTFVSKAKQHSYESVPLLNIDEDESHPNENEDIVQQSAQ